MTKNEFLVQQFLTLRDEIKQSKSRMFKLLILGSLFIPAAGFAASYFGSVFATSSMPFLVLVIMLAFIVEQNSIIRAGRYIRENIEPQIEEVAGWEKWLEGQGQHRSVDRVFFGSFLIIYLIFYAVATGAAVEVLVTEFRQFYYYAALGYGAGGLWFVFVLIRYWRACTTTQSRA